MGETRGNIHYHVQRLLDGGVIVWWKHADWVASMKSTIRRIPRTSASIPVKRTERIRKATGLFLTAEEAEDLLQQVGGIFNAWEIRIGEKGRPCQDYELTFDIRRQGIAEEVVGE